VSEAEFRRGLIIGCSSAAHRLLDSSDAGEVLCALAQDLL
jgi:hypothetical protein